MKVVYYSFVINSKHGGSSHAFQFLNHLRNSSIVEEVILFPNKKSSGLTNTNRALSYIKTLSLSLIPRFFKRNRAHYQELKQLIIGTKPQVLIIRPDHNFLQIGRIRADFPELLLAAEINSSSFDESYSNIPFGSFFKRMERNTYQRSDLNFFVSEDLKTRILGTEEKKDRDYVVYNGTDPQKFNRVKSRAFYKSNIGIPEDSLVIGYMGTLDYDKRITMLIEVFSNLKNQYSNLFLLIIGDGPDRPQADKSITFNHLQESVLITGWIDYEIVQDYLFAVDIAVHHYANSFNCPLKILDYLASGTPTIAPDISFVRNNFKNEYHLLITKPKPEAIYSSIQKLIDIPELAENLANQGHDYVLENFTWQKNADFIISKIEKRLSEKN